MKKIPHVFAIVFLFLLLFWGLLMFAIGAAEYATSRVIMDQFSRDGSMESFTPDRYDIIRLPLFFMGGGVSLLGGLGLVFFHKTERFMHWLELKTRRYWKQFRNDVKQLRMDILHPGIAWWIWLLLGLLILLAFAGNWIWVEKPMQHDESYTFIAFARRPFMKVISDYHLPNNHVLNSILIHILYVLFGNISPVIVRLPSLLAGVLCVPLTFVWSRKQYGTFAALLAAGFVGYLPWIKLQSTNGRGYMLMAMFTLLMLVLAERVRGKKDRAAWVLLILATVLNFYTLPIAFYPFSITGLWLLVSALRGDIAPAYGGFWRFFRYLVGYGLLSGILVFLLYSPIFLFGTGWDSFFHNSFVESLDWHAFWQTLPIRLGETVRDWQMGVPLWFSILLGTGIILSVVFHRPQTSGKTSMQICALAALSLVFAIQRPNPWTRIWTFLLPMLLTWAAAGWFLAVGRLVRDEQKQHLILKIMLPIFMVLLVGLNVRHLTQNMQYFRGEYGQEETVSLALQPIIHPDDIVLTSVGYGPAFWYYFDLHGLPVSTIVNPVFTSDWQNLYLVVDDREDQSPEDLLAGKPVTPDTCRMDTGEAIYAYGHYRVYVCQRY